MPAAQFTFTTADGYAHFALRYPPAEGARPRGSIVIAHGLGEHCGRYAHVAEYLTDQGYAVLTFDARGHGQTGTQNRDMGYFEPIDQLLEDLHQFLTQARSLAATLGVSDDDNLPFLLGHSMGGLIALRVAELYPTLIRGLILTSPWLDLHYRASRPMRGFITAAAAVFPKMGAAGVDIRTLSRDQAVVSAYGSDPLVWHNRVAFRIAAQGLALMGQAVAQAARYTGPALWMYGTADALVHPLGNAPTFAALGSSDKTLIAVEGGFHELLNEPDRAAHLQTIGEWMNRH